MTDQFPPSDESSDGRLVSIVALCLLLVGTVVIVAGAMLMISVPAGLIVLGGLLLGAGIALGLR